jgi:hypothetical protein
MRESISRKAARTGVEDLDVFLAECDVDFFDLRDELASLFDLFLVMSNS